MTDEIFMARLHGYAYATQAQGYRSSAVPDSFQPIIPYFSSKDGLINRQRTLDSPAFSGITGVERRNLLATDAPGGK
jgi:hypothetical protein